MAFDPNRPYQELPELPPAAQLETIPVLKALPAARAALAELDSSCALLPDPTILINVIPLFEAQASSEIENIVTTRDELFKASNYLDANVSPETKETLNYRTALRKGYESLQARPLGLNTARTVCSALRGHDEDIRSGEVYIGSGKDAKRIYTPPAGKETLLAKLTNWENYLHQPQDVDPLIRIAVAHYQFEAIHPFDDGNGRTGRIINLLALSQFGLLKQPVLYLSGHIVRTKNTYYQLLREITTSCAWEPWLLYMIEGITETATWTHKLIIEIYQLRQSIEDQMRLVNKKLPAADICRVLFSQPYARLANIMDATGASRPTATHWMRQLASSGLVDEVKAGRQILFINSQLLNLLLDAQLSG